jgi:hypothetical protein
VLRRSLILGALAALLTFAVSTGSRAQDATASDTGATSSAPDAPPPRRVRWHDSTLVMYQRVGAQTAGVGSDYQSRNPFYETALYLRPRYYLWERGPSSLSLRGQVSGTYEITNSDYTTKRGEVLLEDSLLSLVPEHVFGSGEDATLVAISVPRLTLPTSYASRKSGKIADVGVRAFIDQGVPLRTTSKVLPRAHVAARLGYAYGFVTGTVPTADTISRLRRDLDGHTVRNDQIGGAAFAEHIGVLHGILSTEIYADLFGFDVELGIDPAYKRKLPTPLVTGLDTGPYLARSGPNPERLVVSTFLDAKFVFTVKQMLGLWIGYENITGQLREDGQRRNVFYSPDAKFYLAAELLLDKAYAAAAGSSASNASNAKKTVARAR